jgi:hypothetical protein
MKPAFLFGNLKWWSYEIIVTWLNSQKRNEYEIINKLFTLICIWILVLPVGIIEVSTTRKLIFLLYFSSLHDYWPPSTCNSLVHTSWGEMEGCEKGAFLLLKMRKMKNQFKTKNHVNNRLFIDSYVLEYEGLYFSLRGEHIKDKRLH